MLQFQCSEEDIHFQVYKLWLMKIVPDRMPVWLFLHGHPHITVINNKGTFLDQNYRFSL